MTMRDRRRADQFKLRLSLIELAHVSPLD